MDDRIPKVPNTFGTKQEIMQKTVFIKALDPFVSTENKRRRSLKK